MWTCLRVTNFAKKVGFKHGNSYGFKKELRFLQSMGYVDVQQGGFNSDSMNHHKIVVVKDEEAILRHFQIPNLVTNKRRKYVRKKATSKCKHEDFSSRIVIKEVFTLGKSIRTLWLRCKECQEYFEAFEVDGILSQTHSLRV